MRNIELFNSSSSLCSDVHAYVEAMAGETASGNRQPVWKRALLRYQKFLDDLVPYKVPRWVFVVALVVVYAVRVTLLQGWYIVTYALAIYILNLFIAFLSPKFDPALQEENENEDSPKLPTMANEEFKPFIRRLPEFKFWHSMTRALLIALLCTCFSLFNIPVFWPILVLYFIILFSITMKRQLMHMVRYRYLPFSYGKRRYKGKEINQTVLQ